MSNQNEEFIEGDIVVADIDEFNKRNSEWQVTYLKKYFNEVARFEKYDVCGLWIIFKDGTSWCCLRNEIYKLF